MKLRFLGGAGTVTGSKYLLSVGKRKVLVDCGLFQGVKEHRLMNWAPLPVNAAEIEAVLLTHAHLDHSGYLPILVRNGFRGRIFCSRPTAELARLVLLDAAKIQEEDAEHANRNSYSKHKPALPLYTVKDAEGVLPHFNPLETNQWQKLLDGALEVRLQNSGHILGSTFIEIQAEGKRLVFTGDIGRANPLTLRPRTKLEGADFLVTESTYGDRCHPHEQPGVALKRIIGATYERGGHVLIAAFALGRTQDILHLIAGLKSASRIPNIPVYLDSPMGEQATSIFDRYPEWHRLSSPDLNELSRTCKHISTIQQSAALTVSQEPAIVIAGSGMVTGGRIKHHLEARISSAKNTLILTGYQAAGTIGRFLKEGAEEIKLFGQYLPVRAEIEEISSLSAHADQHEIIDWIGDFKTKPKNIFITHGEPNSSEGLRVRIADQLAIQTQIPKLDEELDLK